MLISVRRIATAIASLSRSPPDRSQPRRVLPFLPRSPLATGGKRKSVLEAFKDHGFTDADIEIIARKAPGVVAYRSGDLVGAKMSYLCRELGLDRSHLVKVVTTEPSFLRNSLAKAIIPSVDYLVSLLGSRRGVVAAVVRAPWLLPVAHSRVAANVGILKDSGVPDTSIAALLLKHPRALAFQKPERFRSLLDYVWSSGPHRSAPMFVRAIGVRSSMSSSAWEKKVGVFLSFGWSAEEIKSAFRRSPPLFGFSEEHLRRKLHFLMNVLGMRPAEVLKYKVIIACSLEGNLIPRCYVLNALMGKGLVRKDLKVPAALCLSKHRFARRYVEMYQCIVPQVLEAYQGKMQFTGFRSQAIESSMPT